MFGFHSIDGGRNPAFEEKPAGAITPKIGMLLKMASGKLAVCTGTDKPLYVSMCERGAACSDGEMIVVSRVLPDTVFETTFAAAATAIKVGDKVTIHTDGEQVTATTTNGVAEVVYMAGTAAGDTVYVRF